VAQKWLFCSGDDDDDDDDVIKVTGWKEKP
jgi:hypothetical protein